MANLAKARVEMENSQAQMAKSILEKTMVEFRRSQAEMAMVQAENERLMVELDYVHKGLPRVHAQNEISTPPQEKMTNLEEPWLNRDELKLQLQPLKPNSWRR